MIRIPTDREPTHPGELLLEDFLVPMNMSQQQLAIAINVPEGWVEELVQAQRSMTPSIALRLAKLLGTSPDFWMNLQLRWDLYSVQHAERAELDRIRPLRIVPTS